MPELDVDDRLSWAVTWTAREPMERSAHALAADGRVWLVDLIDNEPALAAADALGEVVAVVQLLDRHPRDCVALARRYGVPQLRLPEQVPDSPFEVRRLTWVPGWRELHSGGPSTRRWWYPRRWARRPTSRSAGGRSVCIPSCAPSRPERSTRCDRVGCSSATGRRFTRAARRHWARRSIAAAAICRARLRRCSGPSGRWPG